MANPRLVHFSVLLPLVGCTIEDPATDVAVAQLAASIVTTRSVTIGADRLADWNRVSQIDPAIVANATLKVRVCGEHFPVGSQVRANLEAAIHAYSAVPGVTIDITDIATAAGTAVHPDLATFVLPNNAIYVDYDDTLASNVFAGTALPTASCDTAWQPWRCTKARIYVNPDKIPNGDAPSVGVFMHELGHVFGMIHINESDDSAVLNDPAAMTFDRTVLHGNKLQSDDFRSTIIHAGTLAFLQQYYLKANDPDLAVNEIVVHRNVSLADDTGSMHIEFNPSKSYADWGTGASLIANLNETKLRWNPTASNGAGGFGAFEPCTAPGTKPRWLARMSDTSTNTVNTPFLSGFQTSSTATGGNWTTLTERSFDSHQTNHRDFRQIDWETNVTISAAAVGLPPGGPVGLVTRRRLRFQADSGNALVERNKSNNAWWVNLCLYPSNDTTCDQPTIVCAQP